MHIYTASLFITCGKIRPNTDPNPNPTKPTLTLTDTGGRTKPNPDPSDPILSLTETGEGIYQPASYAVHRSCCQFVNEFRQTCHQFTPSGNAFRRADRQHKNTMPITPYTAWVEA